MTHYSVETGRLFFHPGCNCGIWSPPQPRPWSDASDWINMQSRDDVRERLMRAFGFESRPETAAASKEST